MESIWLYAIVCTVAVSLVSFSGLFLISLKAETLKGTLIFLICFAIGTLLGNTFFHLLPEAYFHISDTSLTAWFVSGGFLAFLLVDRLLHAHSAKYTEKHIKTYGYLSLYADALHNLTDGILIAVAWMTSPELGVASTVAIMLHEIPQEISDFGILLRAGFSKKKALLYNFYSASTAVLGTVLTLWIGTEISHLSIYILPCAAGGFIYLAVAVLLPEVLKKSTNRNVWLYLLFILTGILLMYFFSATDGHSHVH